MTQKPMVAITLGDPCGIGPEIILKAFQQPSLYRQARMVIIGSSHFLRSVAEKMAPDLEIKGIVRLSHHIDHPGVVPVLEVEDLNLYQVKPGKPTPEVGRAVMTILNRSAQLAMNGEADAVVTTPVNKKVINQAGYAFQGHTEVYASIAKVKDFAMMMVSDLLKVVPVTRHLALRGVFEALNTEDILTAVRLVDDGLKRYFAMPNPRIAVAALNPHGGEEGLFGEEESAIILPAVETARAEGREVAGPLPADTLFYKAKEGFYDAVVAMYHDQGLIPFKMLAFGRGVNVTLGLPFIRTSVDHGTAYDIAGQGIADPSSLVAAITLSAKMATVKNRVRPGE